MDVLTSKQVLPSRYLYLGVDIYVSCQHVHSYIHYDNVLASQLCSWLLSFTLNVCKPSGTSQSNRLPTAYVWTAFVH
jgi:hypothetical protein